jgi:hypothetical protein
VFFAQDAGFVEHGAGADRTRHGNHLFPIAPAKPNLNSEAGLSAGKSLILALWGAASSRL